MIVEAFGNASISEELFDYIRSVVPEGETILELGSGWGTDQLMKHYTVVSIEHSKRYADMRTNRVIHADYTPHKALRNHEGPMKWYDRDILIPELEGLKYSLLLVDGPPQPYRCGIVKYIELFDTDAIIVFDDQQRKADRAILNSVAAKLRKPYVLYPHLGGKPFGVINDPCLWSRND